MENMLKNALTVEGARELARVTGKFMIDKMCDSKGMMSKEAIAEMSAALILLFSGMAITIEHFTKGGITRQRLLDELKQFCDYETKDEN